MSEKHPIEGLMDSVMQGLKDIVDVNTIVGNPITCPDGTVIMPISKVALGCGVFFTGVMVQNVRRWNRRWSVLNSGRLFGRRRRKDSNGAGQ